MSVIDSRSKTFVCGVFQGAVKARCNLNQLPPPMTGDGTPAQPPFWVPDDCSGTPMCSSWASSNCPLFPPGGLTDW